MSPRIKRAVEAALNRFFPLVILAILGLGIAWAAFLAWANGIPLWGR